MIAFETRLGAYAFGRGGGGEIGAAVRFAQGEGSERGALPRRERGKDAPRLFRRAAQQHREQAQHGTEQSQRDVDINNVELFGQHRHVHNTCALTAERHWNQAAQEARCEGLFVERSGGGEAGERRRQVFRGRSHLRQHIAGEGACVRAQALLFRRQREIDRHGAFPIRSAAEPRRSMTKTIGVTDDWGDISLATNMVVLRDEVSPARRLPPVRRRLG